MGSFATTVIAIDALAEGSATEVAVIMMFAVFGMVFGAM